MLCEGSFTGSQPSSFVAGIGVNLNQPPEAFSRELAERATSVRAERQRLVDMTAIVVDVIARCESWWEAPESVLERWRDLSDGATNRAIHVQPLDGESFTATTRGLVDDGGLKVQLESGAERILYSEDVLYIR